MLGSTRARVGVGVLVLLVLASIGTYAFLSSQKPAAASAAATLTIYKGTAQRAPAGSNTFSPVLSGQGLSGGDQIRTGAATAAAIRFGDGSITRLDSNTTITIKALTHQGSEYQTTFSQSAGKTWNRVQRLVGLAKFNVTGPNSSTAEVRGTTFVLIIEPNGDVRIDDYQGTVIFHGKAGSVTVTTGQSSTILNGTSTPQPATGIPTADLQDPFTVFNIAADANLDATGNGSILSVNANNTIAVAETQGAFVGGAADGNSDLSFTLDWPGSTFEMKIIDPDGVEYDSVVSDQHPVTYTVPKPRAGDWSYQVHDISSEKPKENWSVVVGAIRPAKKTPNLFFRGGSNQVCDHTVIGGKTDTWSLDARDASGAPTLSTSSLPDYGTFASSKGTGTFKFTPSLEVAPADLPITVTAVFAGDTATINCTEHVIPPKNASVGGTVLSGGSGLSGVLVTLTMPDSSTQIGFTDAAGTVGFSALGAGDFTLAMTVPSGYTASGPTSQTVTLDGNTAGTPVTFNLVPIPNRSSVGATVLSGTAGVPGVLVTLTLPDASSRSASSDGAGKVGFSGLVAGDYTLAITVPNGYKATGPTSQTVTLDGKTAGTPLTFNLTPFAISLASFPNESVGDPPCSVLTLIGGVAPITWKVSMGGMPTGTGVDVYGHCNGTPTAAGTFTFTLSATDANGDTASHAYTITVFGAPSINGPSPATAPIDNLRPWDQGFANPQTLTGTGGIAPYTWSVVSGALPAPMSIGATTGTLSGAPTDPQGSYSAVIQLTDSVGAKAYRTVFVTVVSPPFTSSNSLRDGAVGDVYGNNQAYSGGGVPPYSLSATGLPPGLTPSLCIQFCEGTTVELVGTPTAAATYPKVIVTFSDSVGGFATFTGTIVIASAPLAIQPSTLPVGTLNAPYTATLTSTGGLPPPSVPSWYYGGGLPAGLTFDPVAHSISGTPTTCGSFTPAFQVYDNSSSAYVTPLLDIGGGAAPQFCSPQTLPSSDVGLAYSQQVVVEGGTTNFGGTYTWQIQAGSAPTSPPSLTISSTGVLQSAGFTLLDQGTWTFIVIAIDPANPNSLATQSFTLVVYTAPSGSALTLPNGVTGTPYNQVSTFTWTGGNGCVSGTESGGLPPGMYLVNYGCNQSQLNGAPTNKGVFSFMLTPQDANGFGIPVPYVVTITDSPLLLAGSALPASQVGGAYASGVGASGGSIPYTYAVTGGSLPPGLVLDSATGNISGTPTTAGPSSVTIQATDASGTTASGVFTITIDPTLTLTPAVLPGGTTSAGYSQQLVAAGGSTANGPYNFFFAGCGSLTYGCSGPVGLTLSPAGLLTGTNPNPVTDRFSVGVSDGDGNVAYRDYFIVFAQPPAILTASLPNAALFSGYCQSLAANGGSPGYTWAVTLGALPTGVVLDAYGHLTGTPTVAGVFTFTVTATDSVGQAATQAYTVTIA